MYVCMYVCMHVCIHVCMCECTYVCAYVCTFVRVAVCVSACLCLWSCVLRGVLTQQEPAVLTEPPCCALSHASTVPPPAWLPSYVMRATRCPPFVAEEKSAGGGPGFPTCVKYPQFCVFVPHEYTNMRTNEMCSVRVCMCVRVGVHVRVCTSVCACV